MKKVLVILILSLFVASTAFAENFISGEAYENCNGTNYGVLGCALDFDAIIIQGLFGLGLNMPAGEDAENDMDLLIGCRAIKTLLEGDNCGLNGFGGVIFSMDGSEFDVAADTEIEIQAGLQPEYFINENISISVMMGIKLNLAGDRMEQEDTGATLFGTFADPMANAVVSWYFK